MTSNYTDPMDINEIRQILDGDAEGLLEYKAEGIKKEKLYLPCPEFVNKTFADSDRSEEVRENFKRILNHGRLEDTGYVSILPVDQGVEHSAGATFSENPDYFDPKNILELAIKGGCNAVASTLGVIGAVSKIYAKEIPFIVKINHNELLSLPNVYDQILFATVDQAKNLGAVGVGATIYFGSHGSRRQIEQISKAFSLAHELGMFTVLWCYLRNDAFKMNADLDYHNSADLTGQANYLGDTIQADIIKQKLPLINKAYQARALKYHKEAQPDDKAYDALMPKNHPIEMVRYQIANCFMGRVPLINSGGRSTADWNDDLKEAIRTAVINKRAGGMGLITGRKAFQRPLKEGIKLLNAIQDVYLNKEITIA